MFITSQTTQVNRRIKAAKAWFKEIITEGVQSIKDALKFFERIRGVEEMLHDSIASLIQEPNTLKEILCDWDQMANADLDDMTAHEVIPSS